MSQSKSIGNFELFGKEVEHDLNWVSLHEFHFARIWS